MKSEAVFGYPSVLKMDLIQWLQQLSTESKSLTIQLKDIKSKNGSNVKTPNGIMRKLARLSSANEFSYINWNKYGVKISGGKFEPASDWFIDTIVFNIKKRSKEEMAIFYQEYNKHREIFGNAQPKYYESKDRMDVQVQEGDPRAVWNSMISLLKPTEGISIHHVDITQDWKGSYDEDEMRENLKEQFPCDQVPENDRNNVTVELDQKNQLGRRAKVYLKMPQQLTGTIQGTSGFSTNILSWIIQENTRLAEARDSSQHTGLTRFEVSFYPKEAPNNFPGSFDEAVLEAKQYASYFNREGLVYHTPHAKMWEVYLERVRHSLILVDQDENSAFLIYGKNSRTGDLTGVKFPDWAKNEKQILQFNTFNGNLPIDIMYVQGVPRQEEQGEIHPDVRLTIQVMRKYKKSRFSAFGANLPTIFSNKTYKGPITRHRHFLKMQVL